MEKQHSVIMCIRGGITMGAVVTHGVYSPFYFWFGSDGAHETDSRSGKNGELKRRSIHLRCLFGLSSVCLSAK